MEVDGRGRRKYVAEWIVAVEDERWVNALRNCKPLRVFLAVTGPHSSETPIQRRDQPIHLPLIGFQFAYVKSGPRHRAQSYDMRALEALPQTCPALGEVIGDPPALFNEQSPKVRSLGSICRPRDSRPSSLDSHAGT